MKESRTISLEPEDWEFIDDLIKNGTFDSVSGAIRHFVKDARRRKKIEIPLEDCESG